MFELNTYYIYYISRVGESIPHILPWIRELSAVIYVLDLLQTTKSCSYHRNETNYINI